MDETAQKKAISDLLQHVQNNSIVDQELQQLLNSLTRVWCKQRKQSLRKEKANRAANPFDFDENDGLSRWLVEASATDFYDEIYDENGDVREAYQGVMQVMKQIEEFNPERFEKFESFSYKSFMKDNKLYHIPRMLSQQEHKLLISGVQQRARAIQLFLLDHYSSLLSSQEDSSLSDPETQGENSSLSKSQKGKKHKPGYITGKVIPGKVMKDIVGRSSELVMRRLRDSVPSFGFWYCTYLLSQLLINPCFATGMVQILFEVLTQSFMFARITWVTLEVWVT